MKKYVFIAVLVLSGILLGYNASAAVYEVDLNYNAATPGFGVTKFNTIKAAYDASANGDTINVAAGDYHDDGINNMLPGTIAKSISLLGANANNSYGSRGAESIISQLAVNSIKINANDVVFKGFHIGDPTQSQHIFAGANSVEVMSGKSNITITNNIFHKNFVYGIIINSGTSNINISGNLIDDAYISCIKINGSSNLTFDNNMLRSCGATGGVSDDDKTALILDNVSSSNINNNSFQNSKIGIHIKSSTVPAQIFRGNTFGGNTNNFMVDGAVQTLDQVAPTFDSITVTNRADDNNLISLNFSEPVWNLALFSFNIGAKVNNVARTVTIVSPMDNKSLAQNTLDIKIAGTSISTAENLSISIDTLGAMSIKDASINENTMGIAKTISLPGTGAAPTISSGSYTGHAGDSITINGTGFVTGATLKIGSTNVTVVELTSTTIKFTIPGLSAGTYDISVTNPDTLSATLTNGLSIQATSSGGGGGGGGGGGSVIFSSLPKDIEVKINNGDAYTESQFATIVISAINMTDALEPLKMLISNRSDFSGATWVNYDPSFDWDLGGGLGNKAVFVRLKNARGESYITSDTIIIKAKNNTSDDEGDILGDKIEDERADQIERIKDDAYYIWRGDVDFLLGYMKLPRNLETEVKAYDKYTTILLKDTKNIEAFNKAAFTNFAGYSIKTTLDLGAGERIGVVNSYKAAFGRLPKTEEEWRDAIKIANGRWPDERSAAAESRAKQQFKNVYLREANMNIEKDKAAVTIMAYGLRPTYRNIQSEKNAIKIFEKIFKYSPKSATEWDTVRAIAYSGATRETTITNNNDDSKVAGLKVYGDEILIRNSKYETYVVRNGEKRRLYSPEELKLYVGKKIFNVSDDIIKAYPDVKMAVEKKYHNGDVLRTPDYKTYIIENGFAKQLTKLEDIIKHTEDNIISVSVDELKNYQ